MDRPKPVSLLFLDSLVHSEEHKTLDKTSPHEDEIHIGRPALITLVRIPQPGKDLYNKHISITQVKFHLFRAKPLKTSKFTIGI
jgi:hypothetical protein